MRVLKWILVGLGGLLALLLVGVLTLPAATAYAWFHPPQSNVSLSGLQGSIWTGEAASLRVDGHELGRLNWRISPWQSLWGARSLDFELQGPALKLRGTAQAAAAGEIQLQALQGEVDAAWLAPALAIPELTPAGRLEVEVEQLRLDAEQMPLDIVARLYWREAGVRGRAEAQFGDIEILANGLNGRIGAEVRSVEGADLAIDGRIQLAERRYQAEFVLLPRVSSGPLIQALAWVGEPRAEGGRLLKVEGQLLPPGARQ